MNIPAIPVPAQPRVAPVTGAAASAPAPAVQPGAGDAAALPFTELLRELAGDGLARPVPADGEVTVDAGETLAGGELQQAAPAADTLPAQLSGASLPQLPAGGVPANAAEGGALRIDVAPGVKAVGETVAAKPALLATSASSASASSGSSQAAAASSASASSASLSTGFSPSATAAAAAAPMPGTSPQGEQAPRVVAPPPPDAAGTETRASSAQSAPAQPSVSQPALSAHGAGGLAPVAEAGVQPPEATLKLPNGPAGQWRQPLLQALGERLTVDVERGMDRAVIRLDPPAMGSIEIVIRHQGGALQVHMTATHGDVLRQLQAIGESLREGLVQRNFGEVSVQVSDAGQEGSGRQRRGQGQDEDGAPGRALGDETRTAFALDAERG